MIVEKLNMNSTNKKIDYQYWYNIVAEENEHLTGHQ